MYPAPTSPFFLILFFLIGKLYTHLVNIEPKISAYIHHYGRIKCQLIGPTNPLNNCINSHLSLKRGHKYVEPYLQPKKNLPGH